MFAPGRSVHTVVEKSGIKLMFFQKLLHGSREPHEALSRILYAEQDPMLNAKTAELLGHIIQCVSSINSDLVMGG